MAKIVQSLTRASSEWRRCSTVFGKRFRCSVREIKYNVSRRNKTGDRS